MVFHVSKDIDTNVCFSSSKETVANAILKTICASCSFQSHKPTENHEAESRRIRGGEGFISSCWLMVTSFRSMNDISEERDNISQDREITQVDGTENPQNFGGSQATGRVRKGKESRERHQGRYTSPGWLERYHGDECQAGELNCESPGR